MGRNWNDVLDKASSYNDQPVEQPATTPTQSVPEPLEVKPLPEPAENKQRSWDSVVTNAKLNQYSWDKPDVVSPQLGSDNESYWMSPENIARAYRMIDLSAKHNIPLPEWLDPEVIVPAYHYLAEKNQSKYWWNWDDIGADDPLGSYLGMMKAPPAGEYLVPTMPTTTADKAQELYTRDTGATFIQKVDELPAWQGVAQTTLDSPYLQSMGNMLPWALMGAAGGLAAGGPVGAAIGFLTPMVAGLALGFAGDAENYARLREIYGDQEWINYLEIVAQGSLQAMNLPTEALEKSIGTFSYLAQSAMDPKAYGDFNSVLSNLDKVWEASLFTYESVAPQLPVHNILPGVEWLIDMVSTGETDVRFATTGYVHILGQAEPVKVDAYGLAVIEMIRKDIAKGDRAPSEIIQEYTQKFGFSAIFTDMVFQSLADPLNVMPIVERKAVKKYGQWTNNAALVKAAEFAVGEGVVGTMALYGDLLAQGYGPHYSKMTPYQRRLAGINKAGQYSALIPGSNTRTKKKILAWSMNPFDMSLLFRSFKDMTPSSRYREVVNMAHENIGELLNLAERNPEEMFNLVETWMDLPPEDAAQVAEMLDLPDAITIKTALQDAKPAIAELKIEYQAGADYRNFVTEMSKVTGLTGDEVIRLMRGDKAETVIDMFRQKATAQGNDLSTHSKLNEKYVEAANKWFDTHPYHPDHLRAIIHNSLLDVASKWAVKAYGVKPTSKLDRFFSGLKSIQSLLILGFSVRYKVNNDVTNNVTRVVDGLWGPVSDDTIKSFFDDLGIEPYRLRAGLGAADVGVDVSFNARGEKKTREAYEQGGATAAEQIGIADTEATVREALRAKDWTQSWMDWSRNVSEFGPVSKWAANAERKAGAQTMYLATKKYLDRNWNRKADIPRMPIELENSLMAIDSRLPGAVYALLENAHNADQIANVYRVLSDDGAVKEAEQQLAELKARAKEANKKANKAKKDADEAETKAREAEDKARQDAEKERQAKDAEDKAAKLAEQEAKAREAEELARKRAEVEAEKQKEEGYKDKEQREKEAKRVEAAKRAEEKAKQEAEQHEKDRKVAEEEAKRLREEADKVEREEAERQAKTAREEAERVRLAEESARREAEEANKKLKETESIAAGVADVSADELARLAAERLGLDPADVKEMLEDTLALKTIEQALKEGKDITEAIALAEQKHKEVIDEKLKYDLINRAEEVATQVEAQGFVYALSIMTDMQTKLAELWGRHFAEWQRTFDLGRTVNSEVRGTLIRTTERIQNDEWKRHKLWEQATWVGVLDALGFGDKDNVLLGLNPLASEFVLTVRSLNDSWNRFFDERRRLYREAFTEMDKAKGTREKDRIWKELQETISQLYDDHVNLENQHNRRLGRQFMEMWAEQYGPRKTVGVAEWWKAVANTALNRQNLMKDMRAWERGEPVDKLITGEVKELLAKFDPNKERDLAWPRFLKEIYLPAIGRGIKAGLDGAWDVFKQLTTEIDPADKEWADFHGVVRDIEAEALDYYQARLAELSEEGTGMMAALDARAKRRRDVMIRLYPERFARLVFDGRDTLDGVDPRYIDRINIELKKLTDYDNKFNKRNEGIYGPRHKLTSENNPGYPEWFYEDLNKEIVSVVGLMMDMLPSRDQASTYVNVFEGDMSGAYRVSNNPEWYKSYGFQGKRDAVEAAAQRIIDDAGKDEVVNREDTIYWLKKAMVDFAKGEGGSQYDAINLFNMVRVSEAIENGDWNGALQVYDYWLNNYTYAGKLTWDDQILIAGSESNLIALAERYPDWLDANTEARLWKQPGEEMHETMQKVLDANDAVSEAIDLQIEYQKGLDDLQAESLRRATESHLESYYEGKPDWDLGLRLFYEQLRSHDLYGAIDTYGALVGVDYSKNSADGLIQLQLKGFIELDDRAIVTSWNLDIEFPVNGLTSYYDDALVAIKDIGPGAKLFDFTGEMVEIGRVEGDTVYGTDGQAIDLDTIKIVMDGDYIGYLRAGYSAYGAPKRYNMLTDMMVSRRKRDAEIKAIRDAEKGGGVVDLDPKYKRQQEEYERLLKERQEAGNWKELEPDTLPGPDPALDDIYLRTQGEGVVEENPVAEKIRAMEKEGVKFFNWKDREARRRGLIELFGMEEQYADMELKLLDTLAEIWGERHGMDPEKFWDNLAGLQGGGDGEGLAQGARGKYVSVDQGKRLIVAMEKADADTFLHESAHYFFEYALDEDGVKVALKLAGVEALNDSTYVQVQEAFAEGYVKWRINGYAPNTKIARIFYQFRQFLRQVYSRLFKEGIVKAVEIPLSAEHDQLFGRLFTRDVYEMTGKEFSELPENDWAVRTWAAEYLPESLSADTRLDHHARIVEWAIKNNKNVPSRVVDEYQKIKEAAAKRLAGGDVVPQNVAVMVEDVPITDWTVVKPVQLGAAENYVSTLFKQLGILDQVGEPGFYMRVRNGSYLDLVIETQDYGDYQRVLLTHYVDINGDHVIDSEMIYRLDKNGTLKLVETAQRGLYNEDIRHNDPSYAKMFAKNLIEQGFGKGELYDPRFTKPLAEVDNLPSSDYYSDFLEGLSPEATEAYRLGAENALTRSDEILNTDSQSINPFDDPAFREKHPNATMFSDVYNAYVDGFTDGAERLSDQAPGIGETETWWPDDRAIGEPPPTSGIAPEEAARRINQAIKEYERLINKESSYSDDLQDKKLIASYQDRINELKNTLSDIQGDQEPVPGMGEPEAARPVDEAEGSPIEEPAALGTESAAEIPEEYKKLFEDYAGSRSVKDLLRDFMFMTENPDRKYFEQRARELGLDLDKEADMNLAYDLLEGAFNLKARQIRADLDRRNAPLSERLVELDKLEQQIVKARRTAGKMDLQQFSTPLPISEAAGWAADVRPGDVIVEPTAGTANLVDLFRFREDVTILTNEIDAGRRAVLRGLGYTPSGINLFDKAWTIGPDGKILGPVASVTICNPPWGAYSTGKYGKAPRTPVLLNDWSQRFSNMILQRMSWGSRFVGVMPTNWVYTRDRKTGNISVKESAYLKHLKESGVIRAIIESPPHAYDSRATNVGSLLIVYDVGKYYSFVAGHPDDSMYRPILAYGDNAPKNWEEYAALVEQVYQGKGKRDEDRVKKSQEGLVEYDYSETGPDIGIADPAARRGDNVRDPGSIGKPIGESEPARGDTTGRVGDTGQSGARPGGEPGRSGDATRVADPAAAGTRNIAAGDTGQSTNIAGEQRPARPRQLGFGEVEAGNETGGGLAPLSESRPAGISTERAVGDRGDIGEGSGPAAISPTGEPIGEGRDVVSAEAGGRGDSTRLVAEESAAIPTGSFEERYTVEFRERLQHGKDAVRSSGSFTEYVARSPVGEELYHPHPNIVVETKGLSGTKYPELEEAYKPSSWVMDAVRRRVLSTEGNLDPIWAAIQQNDKHNSGILIADDVGMGKSRTAAGFVLDRIQRGKKRILVVTKGNNNVSNLMNREFPSVYAGVADETGYVKNVPNEFPAERIWLNGESFPEVKKGDAPIPTFDGPAVYFIGSHQLIDFEAKLRDLKIDAVVIDEVHEFKSDDTKRAAAWHLLHEDWLASKASIMYLSATPGIDIADLKYLYGLRVWHIDGFDDWVGVVTGMKTVEQVQKESAGKDAALLYMDNVTRYLDSLFTYEETRTVRVGYQNKDVKGVRLDNLFIYRSKKDEYKVVNIDESWYSLIMGESEAEALALAGIIREGVDPGQARRVFRDRYPMPSEARDIGVKDASDLIQKTSKGWNKGTKLSAWDRTLSTAHTEQIMRELKQGGHYMSRDISRAGVEFEVKQVEPSESMLAEYENRVALYRDIYEAFSEFGGLNQGPEAKKSSFGVNGDLQADAKRALFHMRFPLVVEEAKAAIARGEKVVISVVSVGESKEGGGNLRNALSKINTNKVEKYDDGSYSDPEEIPEALIRVAELQEKLNVLEDMASPVDLLADVFGGRFGYITGDVSEKMRENYRDSFQQDMLDVILISGAGKTGISLHDITGKRVHLIVADFEWSASTFKQELGRVDRTGQRTSPYVTIIHSGTAGEIKFVATIANRMKGLGATSKGDSGSTGTSSLTDEFELGSGLDKVALSNTWAQMPVEWRKMFMDKYFADATIPGYPRSTIPSDSSALQKFMLGLQIIPREVGNKILKLYMDERARLIDSTLADNAEAEAKAQKSKGEVLRVIEIGNNIRITQVQAENGDVYGIVNGVLTPVMNTIKRAVAPNADRNSWMNWYQFYDKTNNEYTAGLYLRPSHIKALAELLGARIKTDYTPENALRYMEAGEKIPVRGIDGNKWELYIGQGGAREDKIVVNGAKIGQRNALMGNGAVLHTSGSFFYIAEPDLPRFLERFPIDNDSSAVQDEGRPRTLYQMSADGKPEATAEAKKYSQDMVPDQISVMKFGVPIEVDGRRVVAMAFRDGEMIAYVPDKLRLGALFDLAEGPARLIGFDGKGNWVFARNKGSADLLTVPMEPDAMRLAGPLAMGTIDATAGAYYHSQTMDDGWGTWMRPVLSQMAKIGKDSPDLGKKYTGQLGMLSPEMLAEFRKYMAKVKQAQSKTKLAALRYGERRRDQALLNYSKRSPIDTWLQIAFPYQFWYTRSTANWALRVLDRPALLSFYARLANLDDRSEDDRNVPTRLRDDSRVKASYLPEWAGGGLWFDPMGKLFPFAEFLRPFDRVMQENNRNNKRAEGILRKQADAGKITQEEMNDAILKRKGDIWDRAMREAAGDRDVLGNVLDYMSLFVSPAAYLQIPYQLLSGKESNPMPMSSFIQGLTAATGIQGLERLDVEGNIRKKKGISEFGEWGDWYVSRQIANIVAEDPSKLHDGLEQMVTKQGEIYEEARKRVQFEIAMKQPYMNALYAGRQFAGGMAGAGDVVGALALGWLPANLLPAGELALRGLEDDYYAAWRKYHEGDKEAINTFFAENPEYEARLALFDSPEERMRQFLISEVWDRYTAMDKLQQRAAVDGLGKVFDEQFLSTETRDYESLSLETLASWSKTLGGSTANIAAPEQGGVDWVDQDTSAAYEGYLAERKKLFPTITKILDMYYQMPLSTQYKMRDDNQVLQEYWNWRDMYIAAHPDLIPYVTGEESKLAGAPADVAELVYQYKSQKASMFPTIGAVESEYYDLDEAARRAYRQAHPELDAYYQWQKQWFAANPTAIPFIASTEKVAKGVLGKDYKPIEERVDISSWSPLLIRQLGSYFKGGQLTTGARSMLMLEYERTGGSSYGTFEEWLESLRYLSLAR